MYYYYCYITTATFAVAAAATLPPELRYSSRKLLTDATTYLQNLLAELTRLLVLTCKNSPVAALGEVEVEPAKLVHKERLERGDWGGGGGGRLLGSKRKTTRIKTRQM